MAYSIDFRQCAIDNLKAGKRWEEVVTTFKISRYTLYRWVKLDKQKGSVEDSPRAPYKIRKIDTQILLSMLEKKPDATLKELAKSFNCWPSAIDQCLRKLGVTRKKNHALRRKG